MTRYFIVGRQIVGYYSIFGIYKIKSFIDHCSLCFDLFFKKYSYNFKQVSSNTFME